MLIKLQKTSNFLWCLVIVSTASHCNNTKNTTGTKPTVITTAGADPNFLFLSDIHLNIDTDSTQYGEDTGLDLWMQFQHKADSVLSTSNAPKFIVYTGDLPAHYAKNDSGSFYLPPNKRKEHNENLIAILTTLRTLSVKHKTPLFYLPGNNDALAGDYYSFADEQQQTPFSLVPNKYYPYPAVFTKPDHTVPPCIVSNPNPSLGFYAAWPVKGLRLIALNTVIWNTGFKTADGTNGNQDGEIQMNWLTNQLKEAETKNENVYIAMHIPPGTDAYSGKPMWEKSTEPGNDWLNRFLLLTKKYEKTITGILYGHTHMDEFRRLYDPLSKAITEVAISCPGITPQHNNNPGFKQVSYNSNTKELMDFTTFYTTPDALQWGNNTYNFNTTFGFNNGKSMYENLKNISLQDATDHLKKIYTVKNGVAGHNIQNGIEVTINH
jgi:3',5'-cyclic AMP phosphodiesterase CpdA